MKKSFCKILFFLSVILSGKILAQQDPMYTMYMLDKMLINPAYTGSSNWMVGTLKYRQQFVGFKGNPATETFNFHTPIQKKHIGVGFKIINDKTDVTADLNASILFSYHLNFAGGKLSAGLEGGIYNRRINYPKLILTNPEDNSIPLTAMSSSVPDAAFGIYYQKKQFYIGYSGCHLIQKNFNYKAINESRAHLYNHMYLLMGKIFDISNKWSFEPSLLIKYQAAASVQLDVNASLSYCDRVAVGIQYRTGDAIAAILKIGILENLRVAYSYDMTISGLSSYSRGCHEIIISYGVKLPPPPAEKEIHPRYYY
jgi:type IX secretion system PorP/SprF family membrane protein